MAMVHVLVVVSALIFLSSLPPLASSSPSSSSASVSFPLTHRDAQSSLVRSQAADPSDLPQSMPMREFVASGRAMRGRMERQKRRRNGSRGNSRGAVVGRFSYLHENVGDFYLTVPVGNPPQKLIFTLDTGSELTWSQCTPCKICSDSAGPSFAFQKSSSFEKASCTSPLCSQSLGFTGGCSNTTGSCIFQLQYGDGSADAGYISIDSFHFGQHFVKPFVFGCAVIDLDTVPTPTSGIMGLNGGPFSFTSQFFSGHPDLPKKFAHCLPDRITSLNSPGIIEFGDYELPIKLSYTPLQPPYGPLGDLYYYVGLEGISIGKSSIKVTNHTVMSSELGMGGTIFDSGTALTHLAKSVYGEVVGVLEKETAHLHPFASKEARSDLCYKIPLTATKLPRVPTMTFHFVGMADLELGPESVLYPAAVQGDDILVCLAFASSPSSIPMNIIGNYQQQNYWIEYNLQTASLGLGKANCAAMRG